MNDPTLRRLDRDGRLHPWGPGIHLATGIARFYGLAIANTTAVIELQAPGELLVWNPIALTEELRASLAALEGATGRRVSVLLCALDYHHFVIGAWQQAFPEARTFLVSERIRQQQPHVRGEVLDGDHPVLPGCEADIALLSARGFLQPVIERSPQWRGGPRREWLVLHRPSRSLLIGDLLFLNARLSWVERVLLRQQVGFTWNKAGFRPGDAAARGAFLEELLAWDFEQALTVHGRATAHGAESIRGALRGVFGM